MNKEKLKGLQSFLKDDIWRVTEDEVSKSRGILYNAIKIATLSVREFTQGRILNKASALTYSTLLSIIPILAILFAIARGFGFSNLLETQFRSGLEGQSAMANKMARMGIIESRVLNVSADALFKIRP
jgi:membrane protein